MQAARHSQCAENTALVFGNTLQLQQNDERSAALLVLELTSDRMKSRSFSVGVASILNGQMISEEEWVQDN